MNLDTQYPLTVRTGFVLNGPEDVITDDVQRNIFIEEAQNTNYLLWRKIRATAPPEMTPMLKAYGTLSVTLAEIERYSNDEISDARDEAERALVGETE